MNILTRYLFVVFFIAYCNGTIAQLIGRDISADNISVASGETDTLYLKEGWNWLSFPRLERTGNDYARVIPVLERLNCFPDLDMELKNKHNFKIWSSIQWYGELNDVLSTEGYQLYLDLPDYSQPEIVLSGSKLDPATEITIYPDRENWVGYFIEASQMPEEAIPAAVWEHLTMVKAQYWAMIKTNSEPPWKIKGRVTPLRYGGMIILETDAVVTFNWNLPQESAQETETLTAAHYTFDEQADYLPIFVETDSAAQIDEIAVTADGQVVGAAVRLPGDTLVEVNAYLEGVPAATPLELETWSDYKSTSVKKGDYAVWDETSATYLKRNIYKGEHAKYHIVSLKAATVARTPDIIGTLECSPNPFRNETHFSFRLNGASRVSLRIYNPDGKLVNELLEGTLPAGYYKTVWDGTDSSNNKLENGIYFYVLEAGNNEKATGKTMMIK